eukprot:50687_1
MRDKGENVQDFLLGCIIEQEEIKYTLQELLVYGYIRQYCMPETMPNELQQFCMAMFLHDLWNVGKHRFTKGLEFGLTSNNVSANAMKITSKTGHHWSTAFGKHVIRKGQLKRWTLRQIRNPTRYNNDTMVGIIRVDKTGEIGDYFADKINGGYGILSKTGKKVHCGKCCDYSKEWNRPASIQMTLDMTGIKDEKYGILSYVINNKNYMELHLIKLILIVDIVWRFHCFGLVTRIKLLSE